MNGDRQTINQLCVRTSSVLEHDIIKGLSLPTTKSKKVDESYRTEAQSLVELDLSGTIAYDSILLTIGACCLTA